MDAKTEFLRQYLNEEQTYWVFSALRGPDSSDHLAVLVKWIFTQRIRAWLLIPAPQRLAPVKTERLRQVFETIRRYGYPQWWSHWAKHMEDALHATSHIPSWQHEAHALMYLLKAIQRDVTVSDSMADASIARFRELVAEPELPQLF